METASHAGHCLKLNCIQSIYEQDKSDENRSNVW